MSLTEELKDWPEVVEIHKKLAKGEKLNTKDLQWIEEISKESGWSMDDVVDEIKNVDKAPSSRIEKYQKMFEEYYNETKDLEKKGIENKQERKFGELLQL